MQGTLYRTTVDYFLGIGHWLADLAFPIRCIGCGTYTTKHPYLCKTCFASLTVRQGSECIGCKSPVTLGITCTPCQSENAVDQLLIVGHYQEPLMEKVITTWKYRFINSLEIPFHHLLKKYLHQMHNRYRLNIFRGDPVIIPVPLSKYRLNWRGFNQAAQLAERLSTTFHISYAPEALLRPRHRTAQAQVEDRATRLTNLKGAFRCPNPDRIKGKDIILIDDVCTTGATLHECARVLKENGAHQVSAVVIARG